MTKKIFQTTLLAGLFSLSSVTLACSNVFISGPKGIGAVARTMDLELNTGNTFGYGGRGWVNVSNINLPQKYPIHPMKWTSSYAFVGQSMLKTFVITDGLNTEGLYAAWLDLPDVSDYPTYNPKDKRPEIGMTDLTNFVLGTAKDVPEALDNIRQTQPVLNALSLLSNRNLLFGGSAIHLVLRDAEGNSAVVEWTQYKGKPTMHYYVHKAGTDTVVETMPDLKTKPIIFKDALGSVVTNAPDYAWQLKNAAELNRVYTGNTNQKWQGLYMNGSGMYGLPGDWTPPSRFTRATQLIRVMPKPNNEEEALALAYDALQTVKTQIGTNPAPSLWATVSDLQHRIYYYKPLLFVSPNFTTHHLAIKATPFNTQWQAYDVRNIAETNRIPRGWVTAQVKPGPIATQEQAQKSIKMTYLPTPGSNRTTLTWVQ